jgi:hypothetical protein
VFNKEMKKEKKELEKELLFLISYYRKWLRDPKNSKLISMNR